MEAWEQDLDGIELDPASISAALIGQLGRDEGFSAVLRFTQNWWAQFSSDQQDTAIADLRHRISAIVDTPEFTRALVDHLSREPE